MDNIIVTTHEDLGNDHAGTVSRLHGKEVPFGFAGYVPQDAGFAVCHECALEHYEEKLKGDMGGLIRGNTESDYPGFTCEECNARLDTYVLVYNNQDPELYFRVRMSERLADVSETILSIEEIANRAAEEAYEMGYADAQPIEGEFGEEGEYPVEDLEVPTDSARWANHTAPELRSLAGYEDGGHGTFQEEPIDVVHHIFNEDVIPAYREGYFDRAMGE